MRVRNAIGAGMIVAVLAASGWFVAVSPSRTVALREEARSLPSAAACAWEQPWTNPSYLMSGWSQPETWWHKPGIKVLWSNAREPQVLFHLAPDLQNKSVDVGIKYPAVNALVEVFVNGQRAGRLDRNAHGSHEAHEFHYRLPGTRADDTIDIRFRIRDPSLLSNDGRYLGVLLEAVKACPG